jgi:hypothetical protein
MIACARVIFIEGANACRVSVFETVKRLIVIADNA